MSVKIVYQDVAVGAAEDASVSVSGQDEISTIAVLPFGSGNPKKYVTLEHNLWALDGTWSLYDGGTVAFWSQAFSGDDCAFASPPTITAEFTQQFTSLGIYLEFGGDCWCSDLQIQWYRGATLLDSLEFHPDGLSYFCSHTVTAYDKVIITLLGTSLPRRRARLDMILFGIVRRFLRDELRHVGVEQEIDPTSRELAANALDWTLSSKSAVEYLFQLKQSIYAYDGDTLIGVFCISDSNRLARNLYDITCTDAIGVMDDDPFPDAVYVAANAYTLAQEICGGFTVEMDSDLRSESVTGVLVGCSRRSALQQLCFALGAVADTSGTTVIRIFRLSLENPTAIPARRTRTGGSVKKGPIVTEVRLTAHSYSTTASEGAEQITVNGVTYYDTQTVTVIRNPLVTVSDKPNVVEITDATLISSENVEDIAQFVYDCYTRRDTHRLRFRPEGERVGDCVTTVTPWGDTITGIYQRGSITLSGIALSDAEVVGT